MKYYTKSDLEESFNAGSAFALSGGDEKECSNFEHWFKNSFCVIEGGHEWIDNPNNLGVFYCKYCGTNK